MQAFVLEFGFKTFQGFNVLWSFYERSYLVINYCLMHWHQLFLSSLHLVTVSAPSPDISQNKITLLPHYFPHRISPPPYTYSEGELMETCMLKAGEAMCPEKHLDRCHTSNSHFQLSRWSTRQGRNGLGLCYQPSYRWHALNDQEKSRCCDKIQRESTDCKWRTWYWTFYCILRQEPLCCKTLKMDHVTEVIV